MLFFGLFQTVLPQLVLFFCWPKKSTVRGPSVIQFRGGATPESTETADTRTKTPLRPSSAEIGILSAKFRLFSPEFTAEVIADS